MDIDKELWSRALCLGEGLDMMSGVPQDFVWGPVLINIFINDTSRGIKNMLSKFAGDTRLRSSGDTREGQDAMQRNLDNLRSGPHEPYEIQQVQV